MIEHLYEDPKGVLHHCESNEIHPGINLVWTKCGKDVPVDASFKSNESATCSQCLDGKPATPTD